MSVFFFFVKLLTKERLKGLGLKLECYGSICGRHVDLTNARAPLVSFLVAHGRLADFQGAAGPMLVEVEGRRLEDLADASTASQLRR